jgi:hypothetical protein
MTAVTVNWEQNSVTKNIFIWDWEYPIWVFKTSVNWEEVSWRIDMCWEWRDWIEVTRLDQIEVNAKDSVNLDNTNWWLSFTWDFWDWEISETQLARHKYRLVREECYPIKVAVKDNYSKKVSKLSDTMWVRVVNKKPEIWWLQIIAETNDKWEYITPLKVDVYLNNTKDQDWNIVKYKWYYQKPFSDERLWYIETVEPKNQFYIEADWVKWLTNDYVFNVEVEDNEWWVSSVFDLYWEVNRISVKNGETKALNLDFEVNKTQALIWEQLVFRVKSDSNFSGDYEWDFNWDEIIDKKTKEKDVQFTFEEAWTYKIELRVENNWVYERVYKTIYIDEEFIQDLKETSSWVIQGVNTWFSNYTEDDIISTDLWIKLKWDWVNLTSLNVRIHKYPANIYEIVSHITNSDATVYNWDLEFVILKWEWEMFESEVKAESSIAKAKLIKTWDWTLELKVIAKDTLYWALEEIIVID